MEISRYHFADSSDLEARSQRVGVCSKAEMRKLLDRNLLRGPGEDRAIFASSELLLSTMPLGLSSGSSARNARLRTAAFISAMPDAFEPYPVNSLAQFFLETHARIAGNRKSAEASKPTGAGS